jgi:hypothetical protein
MEKEEYRYAGSEDAAGAERLGSAQLGALSELRDYQMVGKVLFQWEARRLKNSLGADHPRVRSIERDLVEKAAFLSDIEVELEVSAIKTPEVAEGYVLIHGRVSDEKKRGIANLDARLESRDGKVLSFAGQPKTDASGYYAFVLDSKRLEKLSKLDGICLALVNRAGRVVHREPEAVTVAADDRLLLNIILPRSGLHSRQEG